MLDCPCEGFCSCMSLPEFLFYLYMAIAFTIFACGLIAIIIHATAKAPEEKENE